MGHHSSNTVIKNDVRARQLIIVTLNPEKIGNSNVKCRSLWCTRMRSNQWSKLLCIGWSHVALWEHLLQEGIQILCQKEQSDNEYSPRCRFNKVDYPKAWAWVFRWNLLKLNFEMENSKGTKRIYHIIKSRVSKVRGSELSNSVLTIVQLRNDSMEG
jgi:hypothetical protein